MSTAQCTTTRPNSPLSAEAAVRPIKPIFVVGGLYSLANGVAWIMRDLAAALGRAGAPVDVYAADCWGRGAPSVGHIFEPPSRWITAKGLWLGGLSWSPGLKPLLRQAIDEADVVHNHSVWMLPNSYSSRIARSVDKPVVITAHGTLEPWALNRSRWKKRATGLLFQDRDLREADCIHVNSQQEIAGVRSYGLRNPIAVIPNGVDLAAFDDLPPRSAFDEVFPQLADKRLCLFLSRLHDKKGLGHLIAAWSRLGRKFDDWHLLIAGPDDGYERRLRDAVTELNLTSSVTIAGPLYGDEKRAALSAAELFVLPSFSEGFSMAVLEAMACGLPVLITSGCNFAEAGLAGAAIEAAATVEGTESGLRELLSRGAAELKAMGELGRALIELRYTWDAVAQRTLELYGWLARGGARPKFVVE